MLIALSPARASHRPPLARSPLAHALLDFGVHGFAPWQPRFEARDVLRGRPVTLSDGRRGLAASVDAQGVLQLRTEAGWESVLSAEVSLRPAD